MVIQLLRSLRSVSNNVLTSLVFLDIYMKEKNVSYFSTWMDDSLISGTTKALNHLKEQLQKHFKCKFIKPKEFLGLDISHPKR
jgi:hypothetical protein